LTCSTLSSGFASLNERRTKGESSASTESARCAVDARWGVGKGRERVLGDVSKRIVYVGE
jgi:hypothetical protein